MDYKKKYENALEWARQVLNGECGFIRKEVEEVFPELKESEGERIRKDILAFIRREGQYIDKYKWHKWIAWLEKQGEQKPTWSEEDKKKLNRIYRLIGEAASEYPFATTCRLIGDKEAIDLQDFLRSIANISLEENS